MEGVKVYSPHHPFYELNLAHPFIPFSSVHHHFMLYIYFAFTGITTFLGIRYGLKVATSYIMREESERERDKSRQTQRINYWGR